MVGSTPVFLLVTSRRTGRWIFPKGRLSEGMEPWQSAEREAYLSTNRIGLELAYSLNESEYRGERTTELTVADIRLPVGVPA